MFVEVITDFEGRFKQLADVCVERRQWFVTQSVLPGWVYAEKWEKKTAFEMGLLYLACFNHLDGLRKSSGIASDSLFRETNKLLDRASTKVGAELEMRLISVVEEAKSLTKKQGISHLQRALWAAGASIATYAATYFHLLPIPQ